MAAKNSLSILQPYAQAHAHPKGPGDARPTAIQIVENERADQFLKGKTVLVTGGSSGIGVETARAFHHAGAHVFITSRDSSKAEQVCNEIIALSPFETPMGVVSMELDSLASVKAGAEDFLSRSKELNILCCNAGIMAAPLSRTQDGFESHVGVNHMAHFLLTKLLMPVLIASASAQLPSRVVNVASMGIWYQQGGIGAPGVLEDLNYDHGTPYEPMIAYSRSKHANILHALEIDRRYGSDLLHPVHAFSLHPGGITTDLWRYLGKDAAPDGADSEHFKSWKNVEQGAATTVWCATARGLGDRGGVYCEDCGESLPSSHSTTASWPVGEAGYPPWTYDKAAAEKLWDLSEASVSNYL